MRQKIIITSLVLSVVLLVLAVSVFMRRIDDYNTVDSESGTVVSYDTTTDNTEVDDRIEYDAPPINTEEVSEIMYSYGLKFDSVIDESENAYVYSFKNTDGVIGVGLTLDGETVMNDWLRRDEWEAGEEATHIIIIWENLDYVPDDLDSIYTMLNEQGVDTGVWVSDWQESKDSMRLRNIYTDDKITISLGG